MMLGMDIVATIYLIINNTKSCQPYWSVLSYNSWVCAMMV